ncbi:sulfotransferase-like domain-containing protein [Rugosimonospora africana]|uniref:Sulfotransferase family protein n=1 Tax=Rugosimonospora africana TaxID=556532 RepID=A0A8J3R3G1_9ACTN|nr:hypothetical protein [Rugosimonospora africana]GIH19416.1 hypothetical protein Raf01_75880 [Rugosimonospora africana]
MRYRRLGRLDRAVSEIGYGMWGIAEAPEDALFAACAEHDVGVIARVPFDEYTLTGPLTADMTWPAGDWRNSYFVGENLIHSSMGSRADGMVAMSRPPVIALWAAPRTMSTAFTRMMMERGDVVVLHEPVSNLLSTGQFEVAGTHVDTPAKLFARVLEVAQTSTVFFKDTTEYDYLPHLDNATIRAITHTFMVRDPADAIASHYAVNPAMTLAEVGFEQQFRLFERVRAVLGVVPAVIDAADLVADPQGIVAAYCEHVGLPYRPQALTWAPGVRPEWQRTEHWHRAASASTSFRVPRTVYADTVDSHATLARFRDHHQTFYDRMAELALAPTPRSTL